jgi:hypothetical protein
MPKTLKDEQQLQRVQIVDRQHPHLRGIWEIHREDHHHAILG